jgi:dihydroneopterin aldolase / 2-amino-4-hydroxy-6-hydroxymethyldihydropteridine diphosphokinase
MYKVFIKNLKLFGYHGVNPEEKINGQDFIFNVSIHLKENCEIPDIALNDNISNTVNYSEIIRIIKKVNSEKKFDLLETLSSQVAQNILGFSPLISKVKVKVEKPNPPIREELESVGVSCKLEKSVQPKEKFAGVKKQNLQESFAAGALEARTSAGGFFNTVQIKYPEQKEAGKNGGFSRFYLSAGSNIGDREKNLRDAVFGLADKDFIKILKVSSIYETEPMYYKEQDSFLNIALEGTVAGDYGPFEFLGLLKSMEYYMGRKGSEVRYGPRLIDLDLLYFDELKIMSDILVIPHPLIKERRFVLLPLAEITPDLEIEGKKIADFLKICKLDEKVVKIKEW